MKYSTSEISISDLINWISNNKINLRPPYQRNFIWTPKDQRLLIDSIHKGYPLPNFFILKNEDGKYEMVDGQQRATTIYKYYNNEFKDSQNKFYKDYSSKKFDEYKIIVVILEDFNPDLGESKEEFFYLVNKRGIHLNPAEVNQAYHHDSDFLKLVYRIVDLQQLIELDIFTDKTKLRMNDRGLIEEIVAYLFRGITDKRNAVESLFEVDIPREESEHVFNRFCRILNILSMLNELYPINQTRYKQKNDFYTLCNFIDRHIDENIDVYKYQYRLLVFISNKGFISPSNEECRPFMDYAINCVSQSNSKRARELRLKFFEDILCNETYEGNDDINEIINYFSQIFHQDVDLTSIGDFQLINISNLE